MGIFRGPGIDHKIEKKTRFVPWPTVWSPKGSTEEASFSNVMGMIAWEEREEQFKKSVRGRFIIFCKITPNVFSLCVPRQM